MQAIIVVLAAFVCAGLAIHRNQQQSTGSSSTAQRTDIDGIAPHIERAAAILEQLRELDDLQTSLELCAPRERAQALRMEWTNHNGSTHRTSLWMDGTDSTGAVLAAAIRERDTLRASLLEEIRAAYSVECVTGTDGSRCGESCGSPSYAVTETTRKGGAA